MVIPVNLPQGQTAQCSEILQEIQELQSQTLQASVTMLNVKVHDSAIRKRLNRCGLFGMVTMRKAFFFNDLCLQKLHPNKSQD